MLKQIKNDLKHLQATIELLLNKKHLEVSTYFVFGAFAKLLELYPKTNSPLLVIGAV